MSLWLRDPNAVPPLGWKYPHVSDGQFIRAPSYDQLYPRILSVYRANNVEPPSQDQVTEWICQNLYVECWEGLKPLVNNFTLNLPPKSESNCCGETLKLVTPTSSV